MSFVKTMKSVFFVQDVRADISNAKVLETEQEQESSAEEAIRAAEAQIALPANEVHDPRFYRTLGMEYSKCLEVLQKDTCVDWYFEIGSRTGGSLEKSQSKSIAVDPFFQVSKNVMSNKPTLHLFQTTSDTFFETGLATLADVKFSLSFLDGLHLFEFLLRDFYNTESNSDRHGTILMHDCMPFNVSQTSRDLDNLLPGSWTGDVWKILPIFKKYRPDLTVQIIDAAPTGLVAVSGLSPDNTTLRENYEAIVAEFEALQLEDFGPENISCGFPVVQPEDYLACDPLEKIKLAPSKPVGFVSP